MSLIALTLAAAVAAPDVPAAPEPELWCATIVSPPGDPLTATLSFHLQPVTATGLIRLTLAGVPQATPIVLIRAGAARLGDGRSVIEPASDAAIVLRQHLAAAALTALSDAPSADLVAEDGSTQRLTLSSAALAAFSACLATAPAAPDDAHTGLFNPLPANRRARVARRARVDYPPAALRADVEGENRVAFTVTATGRAEGCVVTQSAGDASLDTAACQAVRRNRYLVATDAAAEPVAQPMRLIYQWRIAGMPADTGDEVGVPPLPASAKP